MHDSTNFNLSSSQKKSLTVLCRIFQSIAFSFPTLDLRSYLLPFIFRIYTMTCFLYKISYADVRPSENDKISSPARIPFSISPLRWNKRFHFSNFVWLFSIPQYFILVLFIFRTFDRSKRKYTFFEKKVDSSSDKSFLIYRVFVKSY